MKKKINIRKLTTNGILIALGVIGVVIAIVYLGLKDAAKNSGGGSNTGSGDPLGDILNDY